MYWKNLDKIIKAVSLLGRPEGATILDLQERLEISRRSVYRLFETLEEMNFPLFEERNPGGKEKIWRMDEDYIKKLPNISMPDVHFSFEELLLLHFLLNKDTSLLNTSLQRHLNSLKQKLNLFSGTNTQLNKLETIFVSANPTSKDYSGHEETIDGITEAILAQQRCTVTYHAFKGNTVKSYEADPLHLFERDGGLYIFARIPKYDKIRVLAVERIQNLSNTGKAYEYPKDFSPEKELESSLGLFFGDPIEAVIEFNADAAPFIKERHWPGTETIEDKKDGGLILTLKTSGVRDVKRWILGFGSQAKVLSPPDLALEIREELLKTVELYQLY